MTLQHVFISYRHESPIHARAVRRLGELLREANLPVALDQFVLDSHPGGPDTGWPKWCEDQANNSACVIIIGSEGWFAAYDKTGTPGSGLGAATEADLFRQALWDEKGQNSRIRIAFVSGVTPGMVPARLRAWHQFRPFHSDDQLNELMRWVAGCLGVTNVELPTVQWPSPLTHFQPDLANRNKKEWPAVTDLLAGRSRARIVLYEGGSGLGKSELINQSVAYAKQLQIRVVRVDFKGGSLKLDDILGQFQLELNEHLPNFCREGASKTHLLRMDLRALRKPVLVIFDGYEDVAENKVVSDWMNQLFLPEVETALGLAVIVAGQRVPDHSRFGWRDLALHIRLDPILEIEHWRPWIERHYPKFQEKKADLHTVLLATNGNPMAVSRLCEVISKS
jgi:hypothetical protein